MAFGQSLQLSTGDTVELTKAEVEQRWWEELVKFYQQDSLKDCFKTLNTTLQFPFKESEQRTIVRPPAGKLKYFGSVKARYNSCGWDWTEWTLKEGDIIKILSKKRQQGW